MRLWHQKLIKKLPRQQLLGQHREIAALRGNSWGKKHSTVDYVFKYPLEYLVAFHYLIMNEMKSRGYTVDESWFNPLYRGKKCEEHKFLSSIIGEFMIAAGMEGKEIYPEHNDAYLNECLENLKAKGVIIDDY
jgi:uncharacterized protein (TIGR02328 family)